MASISFVGPASQNKLLGVLSYEELARVQRHLSLVEVRTGEILGESPLTLHHCYFPLTAIVSLQYLANDGSSTEVVAIGNEGLAGVNLLLAGGSTTYSLVVQNTGWMFRLRSGMLQEEFSRGGTLQHLLLRYMQALLTQISQSAICNQRHSIDQQLRRWILQTVDRLGSKELRMTHERLANTLGVRREGISEAAHNLQRAGLITYRRGRITVMDRVGVEADCCECYRVVRREFHRLASPSVGALPRVTHTPALAPDHAAPGNGLARTSELIAC